MPVFPPEIGSVWTIHPQPQGSEGVAIVSTVTHNFPGESWVELRFRDTAPLTMLASEWEMLDVTRGGNFHSRSDHIFTIPASSATLEITENIPTIANAQKAVLDAIQAGLLAAGIWVSKNDPSNVAEIRQVTCNPRVAHADLLQVGDIEVRFVTSQQPRPGTLYMAMSTRTLAQFLAEFEVRQPAPVMSTAPTIWERLSHDD